MSKSNSSAVYKIESGIPVPERAKHGVYASTLSSMKTNDSVTVQKMGQVLAFRAAAKTQGISVIAHKQDNGAYRVWKSDKPTATRTVKKAKKAKA